MYHERMSESSEKGLWGKVTGLFRREQKPLQGITSQARPMTPEEDLAQLKDWQGPKSRDIIQAESRARQAINQKKERKGQRIAAGAIGAAALAVGAVATGAIPQAEKAINNVAAGIAQKLDDLGRPDPGTILSNQAKKNLDNSRVPEEPPRPLNPAMKGPQLPMPNIPGLEKPKPV